MRLVVHETPPKPIFQSTDVWQLTPELFVMLITVAVRGDVNVLEFI